MSDIGKHSANGTAVPSPAALRPQREQVRPGKPKGHPKPPGSGRQKGTPNKATADIRAAAQKHGEKAIRELVKLLTKSENEQTRLKAAVELLDRGYGRPVTPNELTGKDGAALIPPAGAEGINDIETARRLAFALQRGLHAAKQSSGPPEPEEGDREPERVSSVATEPAPLSDPTQLPDRLKGRVLIELTERHKAGGTGWSVIEAGSGRTWSEFETNAAAIEWAAKYFKGGNEE